MKPRPEPPSDPMRELLRVQKRMNELCERAMARTDFEAAGGIDSWTPVGDVIESEGEVSVCLELPGMRQEQIDLRMEGDELIVEGEREMEREREGEQFHRVERAYGRFSRRFLLPSGVDRDAVRATYRQGLLVVTLPKRHGSGAGAFRVTIR